MKIILKKINKSYDRVVLKDVSYVFESGKLYVIKGVSGCGKSTLLNIIGGLEKEYDGEVGIEEGKVKTGYIFQYSMLLSGLTVMENLLLIKKGKEQILSLAKLFDIENLLNKFPETLSGGERQRVAVIRTLLINPNMLLADEPTASLDEANSQLISDTIAGLKDRDIVIIVATHEHYFDKYADEIIDLNYGSIKKV